MARETAHATQSETLFDSPSEQPAREETTGLEGCMSMAEELLRVLGEEADVLKRFQGQELLELLPRKEYLVAGLHQRVSSLLGGSKDDRGTPDSEENRARNHLKKLLKKIERMNRANHVFIEGSLSYWRDFMSVFQPPSYGPPGHGAAEEMKKKMYALKGRAFSREA